MPIEATDAPQPTTPTTPPVAAPAGKQPPPVFGDGKETPAVDVKAIPESDGKAKADNAAPPEIEIKLPDGFKADATFDEFKGIAKELGLDSAKAQKLVDVYAKAANGITERAAEAKTQQMGEWEKASKSDKEFGGPKLKDNLQLAEAGLTKYGSDALRGFLKESGLANHPEVIRAFYRIGKANQEDTAAGTMQHRGGVMTPQERQAKQLRQMYDKSPEMFENKPA